MFDRFGNFDSVEEINDQAEKLANEGDEDGLKELARENGIPQEAAELYLQGEVLQLVDVTEAAVGKLEVERQELAIEGLLEDWISYIESECMESEKMARAVRRKRKSLNGCIAEMLLDSMLNQKAVDETILKIVEYEVKIRKIDLKKQAGMEPRWIKYTKIGFPGMAKARKLIRDYYLGIGGGTDVKI